MSLRSFVLLVCIAQAFATDERTPPLPFECDQYCDFYEPGSYCKQWQHVPVCFKIDIPCYCSDLPTSQKPMSTTEEPGTTTEVFYASCLFTDERTPPLPFECDQYCDFYEPGSYCKQWQHVPVCFKIDIPCYCSDLPTSQKPVLKTEEPGTTTEEPGTTTEEPGTTTEEPGTTTEEPGTTTEEPGTTTEVDNSSEITTGASITSSGPRDCDQYCDSVATGSFCMTYKLANL
ncbi:hypothetical protein FOZ63_033241, partial [Perkinsus olseni]